MKFEIKNLSCGYGKKLVVKEFSAELKDGEILCLLGPNGVGKTTVFKTILGFLKPFGGEILADGRNFFALNDKERAKIVSYVPQAHTPPFAFKVLDVVLMGRSPFIGTFENPSAKDVKIALQKLEMLGMSEFADKIYTDISGGERQMVLIARALAQKASTVMLDEPASNLDFGESMGTPLDEEKMWEALELAQAKSFVEEKEAGLESEVSQGGTNYSGGQRQRLAIARALARKPEILIFDDSFSALDYKTDRILRKELAEQTQHMTKLIVAQRISTIMDADQILVLDNGKVVGQGTHKELLATNEVYQEIAYSQLSKEELENGK